MLCYRNKSSKNRLTVIRKILRVGGKGIISFRHIVNKRTNKIQSGDNKNILVKRKSKKKKMIKLTKGTIKKKINKKCLI